MILTSKTSLSFPLKHGSICLGSQNYRTWSAHNPHNVIQMPLHPLKSAYGLRIIGPIFFHETVNAERYRRLLVDPFLNQLDDYLEEEGRLISSGLWPSESPDMTPLDFFLFPSLKNVVFRNPINNLEEL
jgi:hypothetical protein